MSHESVVLIILGTLGVVFHSCLKYTNLKQQAKVANINDFGIETYIDKDMAAIIASFISVWAWFYVFAEITTKYPSLVGFTRTSFFVMGAMGSYIIQLCLGSASKWIKSIVDKKTDIADNK